MNIGLVGRQAGNDKEGCRNLCQTSVGPRWTKKDRDKGPNGHMATTEGT